MSLRIVLNESNASRRVVPMQLIRASDGTSACTNESGRTFYFSVGGVNYGSGGSLSLISADMGMYHACFSASKVSVLGQGAVYYGLPNSSLTALPMSVPFEIVNEDPWTSQVTIHPGTYSTVTVRIEGVDYSGLTIKGVTNYANISNVTLHAGTHSNVTIQGVTRLNSSVTLNAGTHSDVTIQGVTRVLSLSANDDKANYNVATIDAGAVDAVALATDAGEEIADRILARNIAGGSDGGRTVAQALAPLRNRTAIDGSTLTVYDVDDSTSLWTGSISTGLFPLTGLDPLGP